jgi:hypothetical protein
VEERNSYALPQTTQPAVAAPLHVSPLCAPVEMSVCGEPQALLPEGRGQQALSTRWGFVGHAASNVLDRAEREQCGLLVERFFD